ncbi:MAG: CcmD family protein [Deltaproteobacteria bacterium]|nr:CcmD family protein [Deltaproteobacteria bacterium]MCZ6625310.1 CcmD family protein [Deltaproteobacteria bacterium]
MQPWGFVFLAYGIVWIVILLYLSILKRRFHKVEAELSQLRPSEDYKKDG